jgi:hypothetical protein
MRPRYLPIAAARCNRRRVGAAPATYYSCLKRRGHIEVRIIDTDGQARDEIAVANRRRLRMTIRAADFVTDLPYEREQGMSQVSKYHDGGVRRAQRDCHREHDSQREPEIAVRSVQVL